MIEAKLLQAQRRFQELSERLMRPDTLSGSAELQKLTKERSDLEALARKADEYFRCQKEREEARILLSDGDPGLRSLASAELPKLEERLQTLEKKSVFFSFPEIPIWSGTLFSRFGPEQEERKRPSSLPTCCVCILAIWSVPGSNGAPFHHGDGDRRIQGDCLQHPGKGGLRENAL